MNTSTATPTSTPYGFLPYPSTTHITSPGSLTHPSQQQQQQQQQHHQHHHPLGPVASQQLSQELAQELASPPLSVHPSSLQASPVIVSGSSASPISVSSGANLANSSGHPTINTAILSNFGGMLPSPPQHSSSQGVVLPSTPTGTTGLGQGSNLPTTPPHSADLDTILATYSSQPELLKMIIASKTEEDRRWAEEARFKMMDLIMRGENRGLAGAVPLMTGYEGLLAQTATTDEQGPIPTTSVTSATPGSSVSTGNMGSTNTTTTTATPAMSLGGLTSTGKRFMDDGGYDGSSLEVAGNLGNSSTGAGGAGSGFGLQGPEQGLSRKRSVTFAREVHHGHLRSQSLSSMPSASYATATSTASSPSQFGDHHHNQNVIRRTNSLSHLSHIGHGQQMTVTEQRLAAGRPRNDSAASLRTFDDSDDDSEDDYNDHPLLGGMNSRPGSSLSMNNMMGGNGETSLTLDFSDLASVSGHGAYQQHHSHHHHHPHQHQQHQHHNSNPSSTSPSLLYQSAVNSSLNMAVGMGSVSSSSSGAVAGMTASVGNNGATGATGAAGGAGVSTTAASGGGAGGTAPRGRTGTNTSTASGTSQDGGADPKRKRKRREMQPVNKIVDSPEPLVDQYLWKNNGNTTQKKTGCKSIYYKCSNSAGGCTVNKTVTEKEGGGYVTKYRGEHLEDCIKFKRAQMAAQAAQAAMGAYSLQE
ncbi:hypothetical protein KVV02_007698 [Mortierella alpina]|uniref:WRKY domain-containing protein n=1 Tax=Mortierella alpina TaxID=64518 RepID=A0A9P8D035_MORAP|nr:hypothetical protein KVV02_007698 [Mortierella alpina]